MTESATLELCEERLLQLSPELSAAPDTREFRQLIGETGKTPEFWLDYLADQFKDGDPCPALVMNLQPFIVAAYVRPLDTVVMLLYPQEMVEQRGFTQGQRLLAINVYFNNASEGRARDLWPGPASTRACTNVLPLIADLLVAELKSLEETKAQISDDEWSRCELMAAEYMHEMRAPPRDGNPMKADESKLRHHPDPDGSKTASRQLRWNLSIGLAVVGAVLVAIAKSVKRSGHQSNVVMLFGAIGVVFVWVAIGMGLSARS